MAVLRGFPVQGVVACFDEPNQVGDWWDIDAPRNAPAKNPGAHLSSVYWHSEFFQYELAMPIQTVTINHPTLAGRSTELGERPGFGGIPGYGWNQPVPELTVLGNVGSSNHTLVTHNLGYRPLAFVAYQNRMVTTGTIVQSLSEGRSRCVTAYVTNSVVGLRETSVASGNSLPSISRGYSVLVFRIPEADALRALFGKEGSNVTMGRGLVDTSKSYLRRTGVGDSPFDIDRGPTIDINNGRARVVSGGSATTEPGYGGSFSGPSYTEVGV